MREVKNSENDKKVLREPGSRRESDEEGSEETEEERSKLDVEYRIIEDFFEGEDEDYIKQQFDELYEFVYRMEQQRQAELRLVQKNTLDVNTVYKRKADKVRPVDLGVSTGEGVEGDSDWLRKARMEKKASIQLGEYEGWIIGRFSDLPINSRMTRERFEKMTIGEELTPEEKELLFTVLTNREEALAFDWDHCGTIRPEVAPPQEIRTIEHNAWQTPNFPIPKALITKVIEMLQERLKRGTLEHSQGPYRNPWFLVAKKEKEAYRLIVAAQEMNRVTIRDANMPPSVEGFSEEFAGCTVASLLDFFSGYDQALLDPKSRDMTAFYTPIGLLRTTRLLQGATNSVAQFVRIVQRMLNDIIPVLAMPYMDDIGVKGPRTYYDFEEVIPGIRRFMLEHIQSLDQVLERIERAGATIGPKSQYCLPGLRMVGFVTNADGRRPETAKVIKILEWKDCENVTQARGFIGVCVFYRIWIKNFQERARPISCLFKKGVEFEWLEPQKKAMQDLKTALTSAPALVKINYEEGAGNIILTVDASLTGWGAVLQQLDEKAKRHVIRYESGIWSEPEQRYDATKRECRGAMKAIKKMSPHLTGVHFILETDAAVLVAQLNRTATDLPGSLVVRWIAWMRLFDFEVRHIPGKKNTAADGLSRRERTASDDIDDAHEVDIDDWVITQLDSVQILAGKAKKASKKLSVSPAQEKKNPLQSHYSEASQKIARFLTTLKRPEDMTRKDFYRFKNKAMGYSVVEEGLYKKGSKNMPMRLVVDSGEERRKVISGCHEELGHKGRESTYRRVATRFYWEGCFRECQEYVSSCVSCQKRDGTRMEEAMHPTWAPTLWTKVGLDVTHLPVDGGKGLLVVARDDLSGWPEAKALAKANAEEIAKFLWEDIVCRHGIFGRLVVDGGSENHGIAEAFAKKYGIERVQISAYNSKANGMVERGHRSIANALSKMTGGKRRWRRHLHAVLLADRTSIHGPTGVTPFSLIYGREAILPVETRYPVWRLLEWENIETGEELLAVRARQLELRDNDIEEIVLRKRRIREEGKETFDAKHRLRKTEIKEEDTVLAYHSKRAIDMSSNLKLSFRWLGPYRIRTANPIKGTYTLEEFDGTRLKGTYAGNRLKKFVYKKDAFMPVDTDSETSSNETGSSEESDSWEGDSAEDEGLPRATISTRSKTIHAHDDDFVIIPPALTEAEKAQYTQFSSDESNVSGN